MNYVLFNNLANNGEGEKWADALVQKLGVKEDEYKKTNLVGLDLPAFVKEVTAEDIIYLVGGDGTLNRLANDLQDTEVPCPILLISGGTGNDFLKDITENYPTDGYTDVREYIKNLPTIKVKGTTCHFINGIGYGIDGMCCEVADQLKAAGKKKINYTGLSIKLLLFKYKTPNGGGMKVAPDQDRKGDSLTCVIWHGSGRVKTLAAFPKIFEGKHVEKTDMITVIPAKKVKVKFDIPTAMQIDGETVLGVTEYEAWK